MYYDKTIKATPENAAWLLKLYNVRNVEPPDDIVDLANSLKIPEEFSDEQDKILYKDFAIHGGRVVVSTDKPNHVRKFAVRYAISEDKLPIVICMSGHFEGSDSWEHILDDMNVSYSRYDDKQRRLGDTDVIFTKKDYEDVVCDVNLNAKYVICDSGESKSRYGIDSRAFSPFNNSYAVCCILPTSSIQHIKRNTSRDMISTSFMTIGGSLSGNDTDNLDYCNNDPSVIGYIEDINYDKDMIHIYDVLHRHRQKILRYNRKFKDIQEKYGPFENIARNNDLITRELADKIKEICMGQYIDNKLMQSYELFSFRTDSEGNNYNKKSVMITDNRAFSETMSGKSFNSFISSASFIKWHQGFQYKTQGGFNLICSPLQALTTDVLDNVDYVIMADIPLYRETFDKIIEKAENSPKQSQTIYMVFEGCHDQILLKEYIGEDTYTDLNFVY